MKSSFLKKFFLDLAAAFDQEEPANAAARVRERETSRAQSLAANKSEANYPKFVKGLQQGREQARHDTVAKFHMISLAVLRDKLGDRWDEMSRVVIDLAEQVIQRRLAPADVYVKVSDDSFNVLFCGMTEEQTRFKAEAITREIQALLLGDAEPPAEPLVKFSSAEVEAVAPAKEKLSDDELFERLDDVLTDKLDGERRDRYHHSQNEQRIVVKLKYRPTLYTAKSVISIFSAIPFRKTDTGGWLQGSAVYPRKLSDPRIPTIDLHVVKLATANLRDMMRGQSRSVVLIPIHLDSVRHRKRTAIFNLLSALSEDEQRYLVIELIGIEPGTPAGALLEVVSLIKPFCRALCGRVPLTREQVGKFAGTGLTCIGVDLADPRSHAGVAVGDHRKLLVNFHQMVRMVGASSYVFSVKSPDLLASLVETGFDYVNGEALAPIISTVGQPYLFRKASTRQAA